MMQLINAKKIIRGTKLINLVLRKYRIKMFWMIVLGLIAGFFGGLGVSVLIPLFSILTHQEQFTPNFISSAINKTLSFLGIPLNAFVLIALIILLFFLKALVHFWAKYLSEKTAAEYEEDARNRLFEKTVKMDWPNLLKYKSGYLERVLMYDVGQGGAVINTAGGAFILLSGFLVYALIAFGISTVITLSTILFGIVIFFVLQPILYRVRGLIKNMAENEKAVIHQINEGVTGAKTIKAYAVENSLVHESNSYFGQLKKARVSVAFIRNMLGQFGEPAGIIFIGVLFLFTYQLPSFDLASFVVVVYLIQKMFNSIQDAQGQLNNLNELVPYLKVAHDYYNNAIANKETSLGNNKFDFNHDLEFHDVQFSYDGKDKILAETSFGLEKNSSVGLIGPSGVGKTTIADLIMRLLKPQKGAITIDGITIEEFNLENWRKNIAYVPQDAFFINDTIENNIKFFDNSISQENILDASRSANIYQTIIKLENGFKTIIGERGTRLSTGQRQRIALARALARKPKILILDEATSALDNESEQAIQKTVQNLKGKITILTIAHRLATLMNSDKILILENGKIIEQGKPEELLRNENSRFYKIYHLKI